MDFVKASFKISECIDSATTDAHHYTIHKMIQTVIWYAKKQRGWDRTILGGLAILEWQNSNKANKLENSLK